MFTGVFQLHKGMLATGSVNWHASAVSSQNVKTVRTLVEKVLLVVEL